MLLLLAQHARIAEALLCRPPFFLWRCSPWSGSHACGDARPGLAHMHVVMLALVWLTEDREYLRVQRVQEW
jgi:hypothetical protein